MRYKVETTIENGREMYVIVDTEYYNEKTGEMGVDVAWHRDVCESVDFCTTLNEGC